MGKINTATIEGYDKMTPEQKVQALESYEIEHTGYVLKSTFDKTASECADWKRKYKAQLTEEERKKLEYEDSIAKMKTRLEELENEKKHSETKAKYITLGYEESLAESTAKALLAGDMETVFANQKTYQDGIEKKVKADLLKSTKKPDGSSGNVVKTKEDLKKMTPIERYKFSQEHPDEYKAIYKTEV